jgi:hypothetical protein
VIANPARFARHADSIGSMSAHRASGRSVRYGRREVVIRPLYQANVHNGGTSPARLARRVYTRSSRKEMRYPLKPGAQLCGYRTEDRYAMLQVISVPSATDRRLVLFGRTWQVAA